MRIKQQVIETFSKLPEMLILEIIEASAPDCNNSVIGKGKAQKKSEPITIPVQFEGQRTADKDIYLEFFTIPVLQRWSGTTKLGKVF